MRRRRSLTLFIFGVLTTGFAVANGCTAGNSGGGSSFTEGVGGGSTHNPTNAGGDAQSSSVGMLTTSTGLAASSGTGDSGPDAPMNPCGTACGPTELCDEEHLGRDDNCDGRVDEGCTCVPGQAHSCFKGDYSYINNAGCFPGTEKCTELGVWGPCTGGVHADNVDKCYENNTTACHAITSQPFVQVSLKDGTGTFSGNADTGSEHWTVACPTGVSPCPAAGPTPPDAYTALQSGEYTVTYTKTVGGTPASCNYPLIVGARGLRVELTWEHVKGGVNNSTVDLDLHLHKPLDYNPWAISGAQEDCGYGNCVLDSFRSGGGPHWFTGTMPPDAVNWYLDPDPNQNSCYFAPRGEGQDWKNYGKGCHNPRLDIDNITCNPALTDPSADRFCNPENINVDYPPPNQWFRIGVHYFSDKKNPMDIHPLVKIYCGGSLAAELGHATDVGTGALSPQGYSDVVTFPNGSGNAAGGNVFWLVGDVLFQPGDGNCAPAACVVQPLYAAGTQAPLLSTANEVEANFVPDYPNIPTGTGGGGGGN